MEASQIELEYAKAKQYLEALSIMNVQTDPELRLKQDIEYERARLRLENARIEYSKYVRGIANKVQI